MHCYIEERKFLTIKERSKQRNETPSGDIQLEATIANLPDTPRTPSGKKQRYLQVYHVGRDLYRVTRMWVVKMAFYLLPLPDKQSQE